MLAYRSGEQLALVIDSALPLWLAAAPVRSFRQTARLRFCLSQPRPADRTIDAFYRRVVSGAHGPQLGP